MARDSNGDHNTAMQAILFLSAVDGAMTTSPREHERLLRDSRWTRVYSTEGGHVRWESKFLTENLEVSASSVIDSWNSFSPEEQLEFSNAFSVKSKLTSEDEKILDFLMSAGPRVIWPNIALILCQHSDRERILGFLMNHAEADPDSKSNYYQALELINDSRAIPVLKRQYERYRGTETLKSERLSQPEFMQIFDYLSCCRALLILDGSAEFENSIREMLNHLDRRVRRTAELRLSKAPPTQPRTGG